MIETPSLFLTLAAFLLLLGPLVVLHELGHYLAGRMFGVRAEAFSIGIGKELWHRIDKRGTRWRVAAIPLGGYVQFAGDADASSKPDPALADAPAEALKGTMPGAPLWQRTLIVLAGPAANLLVAVAIIAAFAMAYGVPSNPAVVGGFADKSPAREAGLQVGDRITAIDGSRMDGFEDIAEAVMIYPNQQVTVSVERAGRDLTFPVRLAERVVTDRFGNESRYGMLGIAGGQLEIRQVGPIEATGYGFAKSMAIVKTMAIGLKQIITGERSVKEMGGPIKIAKFSGERLSLGWLAFVDFAALISINLAFINLLPIPTLDGGHLAFYAAEAVRRRPLGIRSQEWAFRTGLALVLGVAAFVTLNDIASLFFK
ncbi:MAG: RIP metalloprotease RseP [Novosphingobium sp.]